MINLKLNISKWRGNHESGRVTALTTEFIVLGDLQDLRVLLFLRGGFPVNFRLIWGTSEPHLLVEAASAGEV